MIEQLGITMILLLIGIFFSMFVFLCELLNSKKMRQECTDIDACAQRLVSEWTYTHHQYNWRQKHTNFVSC